MAPGEFRGGYVNSTVRLVVSNADRHVSARLAEAEFGKLLPDRRAVIIAEIIQVVLFQHRTDLLELISRWRLATCPAGATTWRWTTGWWAARRRTTRTAGATGAARRWAASTAWAASPLLRTGTVTQRLGIET